MRYTFRNIWLSHHCQANCGIDSAPVRSQDRPVRTTKPLAKKQAVPEPTLQFRARVTHRGEIAFGPGKAELLAAIQTHGSIAKAAAGMDMSYMRAWTLVKIMNASFREPLVDIDRGGVGGGSARVTPAGKNVLELYHAMIAKSEAATRREWALMRELLK